MPEKEKSIPPSSEKKQKKNSDDLIRLVIYIFIGFIPFIFIIILWILIEVTSGQLELFFKIITGVVLILMPVLFTFAALNSYLAYKRILFFIDQGSVLLEVKVPKDVKKPLIAMELLLEAFHQTGGEGTFIDRWLKGKTRPWFSLEIVSLEGELHFFFWMRKSWKRHIESSIYSQYSEAEISEVEDYTNYIPFDLNKYKYWGCEYRLTKADPYPIKTYIDYGLDKEKKEEHTVDPINSTLEFFASVEKGEYLWTQILVRAHKKEKNKPGTFFKKMDWKEEGRGIIKKIIEESAPSQKPDESGSPSLNLTSWQTEMVKSIERNLSKRAFDVGIRSLYISEKGSFNPITISGLVSVFKQYNYEHMNGFAPTRGHTVFDYPWQDFKKIRNNLTSKKLYDSYIWRSYFYPPYRSPHGVMSTEEMATIFHIPGESSHTPTLPRVSSRKGDAPSNLPI
jgi:hypothetical protein